MKLRNFVRKFDFKKPIKFKSGEEDQYNLSTNCHLCEGTFPTEDEKDEMTGNEIRNVEKVADHCHYTGKFRGTAHNSCNLLCRKPKFIPVIFHNLSGYDSHLIH